MNTNLNLKIKVYDADIYLRLSKEDGDQEESDSIINQRKLILEFLKSKSDIRIHEVRVDDGYSGVDFDHPSFRQMLQDIKNGIVNCVIVKDLSRFGRNHIEVEKYIEKIFPYLGVRFIAVNDNYDSLTGNHQDHIIIPFKNLINDAYCRDISIKTRTNLEVKRKRGDYVAPFAPYGYRKSEENKNKLEIDAEAAETVRMIYKWYLQGNSIYKIADKLNRSGVLTPMDYKRAKGSVFYTGFKKNLKGEWNHVMVLRILSNPVYMGTLVQGKGTTPNYKVKKRIQREESKWSRTDRAHECIISPINYWDVQELLSMDTRTGNLKDTLYCLSGLVKCGDCGANMVRKTVPSGKKSYSYYVCGSHKNDKSVCSFHSIRADVLEQTILKLLNFQIRNVADVETVLEKFDAVKRQENGFEKMALQIEKKKEELQKYLELKEVYEQKVQSAERAICSLKEEAERLKDNPDENSEWIGEFKKFGYLASLSREAVESLVDEILVYEKKKGEQYPRIEVHFRYAEKFQASVDFIRKYYPEKFAGEEGISDGKNEQKKQDCGSIA